MPFKKQNKTQFECVCLCARVGEREKASANGNVYNVKTAGNRLVRALTLLRT